MFNKHQNNDYHKYSQLKVIEFLKIIENKQNNVFVQLHEKNEIDVKKNREALKSIIQTIELCGRQGLALRGGQDSGILSLTTPVANDGNFRSLLRYRIQSGDNLFKEHILNCNKNASYISADIQNDIIFTITEYIQRDICT